MRRYGWKIWIFSFRFGNLSLGLVVMMAFTLANGQIANAAESKTSVIEQSSLTRDLACNTTHDCTTAIRGIVKCSHKLCVCDTGYTRFKNNCLRAKNLHELCEISEQCAMANRNSYCPSSDTLDAKPSNCKCRKGHTENVLKQCIEDPNRGGLGIYGNPHFDTRDLVPIIMGCLAAGLALCACCAGIVQLMRKKRSLQWRTDCEVLEIPRELIYSESDVNHYVTSRNTECEISQERIYFGSDVNHYDTSRNTGFPGPESLSEQNHMVVIPERFQSDLPPSYDEAIIPPSYEEAMKRVKTADTNL